MSISSQKAIDDPAEDAAVLLLRIGLAVLAMAVPISMVFSRRALFILVPIGSGILLIAGLLLSDLNLKRRLLATVLSTAGLSGLGLIAWGALSLTWSPVGAEAAERLSKMVGTVLLILVTAAFLPERTRTSNLNLFPLGIIAAIAITLATVLAGPGAFTAYPADDSTPERAVVSLVVLVWPSLGALAIRDRWTPAGVVVVAVMVAAMAAWTSVALAALALGALAFAISTTAPARMAHLLGLLAAALFLFAPAAPFGVALALKALAATFGDRLDLAAATESMRVWADLVVSEPLRLITGHGADMVSRGKAAGFLPVTAPRSILFEVWYEFGVIGAVLAAVLVYSAFGTVARLSTTVAPFVIAEYVAVLTIMIFGLDTTQLWWVTLLGVVALAFATVVRGQYRTSLPVARLEPQIAPIPR